jgi:hypothetical protein
MQAGLATLRMGGVGGVITSPQHRKQGCARALMEDTVNHLSAQGFDLSCLCGIPYFYHRFGYATVMPYRYLRVQVSDALALSSPLTVRPLVVSDAQALAPLYDRCWRGRVGALARDEAVWRWHLELVRHGIVTGGGNGRVRGYAIYQEPGDWVIEAAAADADAVAALLLHLARCAQETGRESFKINLPADTFFVRAARGLCAVKIVEETRPDAGWQARLLNLASAFKKLEPELSARLARSAQVGWKGCLQLETDIGGVALQVDRTGVRVSPSAKEREDGQSNTQAICYLPQARLTQLLFGYITVAEAAAAPGSQVPYAALPILAALFPPVVAHIAGMDWF